MKSLSAASLSIDDFYIKAQACQNVNQIFCYGKYDRFVVPLVRGEGIAFSPQGGNPL